MSKEIEKQVDWLMSEEASDFMSRYYAYQIQLRKEAGCTSPYCLDTPSCVCGGNNE